MLIMSVLFPEIKLEPAPHTSPSVQYMSAVVHTFARMFVSMTAQTLLIDFAKFHRMVRLQQKLRQQNDPGYGLRV